jgi:hypothetical protein
VREKEMKVGERVEKNSGAWNGEREWENVLKRKIYTWPPCTVTCVNGLKRKGTCDFHGLGHVLRERDAMSFMHWNT